MHWLYPTIILLFEIGLVVVLATHLLLRRSGSTETRLAWLLPIILLPLISAVAYLLLGVCRTSGNVRRHREIRDHLPERSMHWRRISRTSNPTSPATTGRSSRSRAAVGLRCHGGTHDGTDGERDRLLRSADRRHRGGDVVHSPAGPTSSSTTRVANASSMLASASRRGVSRRVLVDAMGRAGFSARKPAADSAPRMSVAKHCPPTWAMLWTRLDIRNHRKIIVVDNTIGWIGSQNIAAASFDSNHGSHHGSTAWSDLAVRRCTTCRSCSSRTGP